MIICNLATVLAEKQLKITRVSKDTGISRTTLTSLIKNDSKGIQLDTLNALCQYLEISPNGFFAYYPYDLDFSIMLDPIKIKNPNEHFAFVDGLTLSSFDADSFITKRSNQIYNGRTEKTFELVLRLSSEAKIPLVTDDSFILNSGEKSSLHFDLLLGQATSSDSFEKQKDAFDDLINKEVPSIFRDTFFMEIKHKIMQEIRSATDTATEKMNFSIDWSLMTYSVSLSFNNAFSKEPINYPQLSITGSDLPF